MQIYLIPPKSLVLGDRWTHSKRIKVWVVDIVLLGWWTNLERAITTLHQTWVRFRLRLTFEEPQLANQYIVNFSLTKQNQGLMLLNLPCTPSKVRTQRYALWLLKVHCREKTQN